MARGNRYLIGKGIPVSRGCGRSKLDRFLTITYRVLGNFMVGDGINLLAADSEGFMRLLHLAGDNAIRSLTGAHFANLMATFVNWPGESESSS